MGLFFEILRGGHVVMKAGWMCSVCGVGKLCSTLRKCCRWMEFRAEKDMNEVEAKPNEGWKNYG